MIESGTPAALEEFRAAVSGPDEEIDLARAALQVARMEYPELDPRAVLDSLDALAARVLIRAGGSYEPLEQIEALTSVVVTDLGLRGARENYYDPRNSMINEVLERREGIPISLSIIYIAVGMRAGVPLGGANVPRHFLVRVLGTDPAWFVDPFNRGRIYSFDQCRRRLLRSEGRNPDDSVLDLVSNGAVLTRLLNNLKVIYLQGMDFPRSLATLDRLVVLNPTESSLMRERGLVLYKLGRNAPARRDLTRYLRAVTDAPDAPQILNLLRRLD